MTLYVVFRRTDLHEVLLDGVYGFRQQIASNGIARILGAFEKNGGERDAVDCYRAVTGPVGYPFGYIEARQLQDGWKTDPHCGSTHHSGSRL